MSFEDDLGSSLFSSESRDLFSDKKKEELEEKLLQSSSEETEKPVFVHSKPAPPAHQTSDDSIHKKRTITQVKSDAKTEPIPPGTLFEPVDQPKVQSNPLTVSQDEDLLNLKKKQKFEENHQTEPSSVKNSTFNRDLAWKEEEQLSLADRKKRYHVSQVVSVSEIPTWATTSKQFPPSQSEFQSNSDLNNKLALWNGDFVNLEVDAIVTPTNEKLVVENTLVDQASSKLAEECASLNGCAIGKAKITRGYDLPAKYVIHTVRPVDESPSTLKSCYTESLNLAVSHGIKTIAFSGAISSKIFGYDIEPATKIALRTVREWLETNDNKSKVTLIIFSTFSTTEKDVYQKLFREYFPGETSGSTISKEQEEKEKARLIEIAQKKERELKEQEQREQQSTQQPPPTLPKSKSETKSHDGGHSMQYLIGVGVVVIAVGVAFLLWKSS